MHVICFYVPIESAEAVKQAMFDAGAGQIGNYSNCSFEYSGTGQFLPHVNAQPTIGQPLKLEIIQELKVEISCDPQYTKNAISALKQSHPYEEVAYHIIESVKED